LVVADYSNYLIRSIAVTTSQAGTVVTVGDVTTLAGSTKGYQDGQGTFAMFDGTYFLRVGPRDEIVITDYFNCLVRVIEGYPMPSTCE